MTSQETTKALFDYVINQIKAGNIKPTVCAKSVCVDAHYVTEDEIGKEHIVWSHGKVEKTITLRQDMVLLKTLDHNGEPVIDEYGHENIYDMKLQKFQKTYPAQINGHYMKDPYAEGSVMNAIALPDEVVDEGITMCPPNWGGYEGTLMKGGTLMFPFDPEKNLNEQVDAWEKTGYNKIDWYPNNEAYTYSPCDKNGTFKNEELRNTFNQDKPYLGDPYSTETKVKGNTRKEDKTKENQLER